jgi:hypothetical protein
MAMAVAAGGLIAGCVTTRPAIPLYPSPEHRRAPAEVATLTGPFASVDGEDVGAKGSRFELLPGCHVAVLKESVGEGSATGAWVAHLPPMVYAFRMQAQHRYTVQYRAEHGSAMNGRFMLFAEDTDEHGLTTALAPVSDAADITACRTWARGQAGAQ